MKQENIKSNRITLSPDYTRENIPALDIRNVINKTRPIAPEKFASKSNTSTTSEKQTVIAKYSLQFKLMLVISLVITIALSVMIALATYFFKDDNTKRIQENNLEIVRIVNAKVFSDLVTEINKGKTLLALKQKFNTNDQKKFFIDQYFNNDNSFIYLGVYKKSESGVEVVDSIYNEKFLQKYSLTEGDIALPIKNNLTYFSKSFDGVPTISNTSQGSQEASMAISIPMEEGGSSEFIIIILLKSEMILEAFKKSGMNTTYMVNEDGAVLAHPDMSLVFSGKNLMDSPIVRSMITSQANNSLESFQDNDGKRYLGSFKKLGFANAGIISVVEEDNAFKPVYQIQARNIYIMIIALCISLIVVFLFAKTISTPLIKLLGETINISKGIFQLNIKRTTNDEVGVLTDYFQTMAQGLEEREKVKSMLGSMIDPVVVSEGMKDLAALKRGDEKLITAFFSDVANFSSISEQLTSVQLASLLNEYLSAMTLILKNHGGVLDKYIGDAIVGIFGAPLDIGEHYLKASRASLEMIQKLQELREHWTKNNLYTKDAQVMDIRIGINTGLAKVGFMGTDAMGSYTMMGDTVNLAARLEAAAKDYGVNILISESVKKEIESEMFTRELDRVRVKGKSEPVKLYELISKKSDISESINESTKIYEEAFLLYLGMNWTPAIKKFQESVKVRNKPDKAAELLIDRCNYYLISPIAGNWDGVFTRKHK
ncbi:MAG: adenylate/guanylate cyclase domain-containing protein [Leptospiraceae bacterium]|nr:adenylate/guanylate cyclase domain-containing protein [Leptospiraceae bacterium]